MASTLCSLELFSWEEVSHRVVKTLQQLCVKLHVVRNCCLLPAASPNLPVTEWARLSPSHSHPSSRWLLCQSACRSSCLQQPWETLTPNHPAPSTQHPAKPLQNSSTTETELNAYSCFKVPFSESNLLCSNR